MRLNSANINVMVKACRKAAKNIIRDFGEIEKLQVSLKGPGDFVTASDKKVEKILIDELHNHNFEVAIETNGTILPPNNIDWICVSPKKNADLVLKNGDELKLVYPQKNFNPKQFELLDFTYFSIQPMDGKQLQNNILKCVSYCMENPLWRLSLQTHKIIGVK